MVNVNRQLTIASRLWCCCSTIVCPAPPATAMLTLASPLTRWSNMCGNFQSRVVRLALHFRYFRGVSIFDGYQHGYWKSMLSTIVVNDSWVHRYMDFHRRCPVRFFSRNFASVSCLVSHILGEQTIYDTFFLIIALSSFRTWERCNLPNNSDHSFNHFLSEGEASVQ